VSIVEALSGQDRALALFRHEASMPVNKSAEDESQSRASVGTVLQAVRLALAIDTKEEEYFRSGNLIQLHREESQPCEVANALIEEIS